MGEKENIQKQRLAEKGVRAGRAGLQEVQPVLQLYQSLVGSPGCLWSEDYPALADVQKDQAQDGLYCLYDESGALIAAMAAEDMEADPEIKAAGCWNPQFQHPAVLSRLGVRIDCQRRGMAQALLLFTMEELKKQGFDGVCLMAGKENPGAVALYEGMGFHFCGEGQLFEIDWKFYEKRL